MKILLINNFFYRFGGVETQIFNCIKILKQHNHEILFFCADHPFNEESEFRKYFVPYFGTSHSWIPFKKAIQAINGIYSFRSRRYIKRLLVECKPDIVHIHDMQNLISPSIIDEIKKFNIPIVKTLHSSKIVCVANLLFNFRTGVICEKCRNGKFYNSIFARCINGSVITGIRGALEMTIQHSLLHIFDKIDLFISPSKFLIKKLKEIGFKREINLLPYCILSNDYIPFYKHTERSIVYFGRLSKEKGINVLIKAMKGLDVSLKIIGDGPESSILKEEAKNEDVKNVFFLGRMNKAELIEEVSKSMFSILPSICYDNYPFMILESFAIGKPVIGANLGGISEMIKDGERGLLFCYGDHIELRSKIKWLISDLELIIKMGKNARAWIEHEFNESIYYKRLMEIYYRLIK